MRDAGSSAYARKLAPTQPEAALTWAQPISDQALREREINSVLRLWSAADEKAATEWIQATASSNELKTGVEKDR